MPKPSAVPRWDWLMHELWWRIARWPEEQRATGRSAIRNEYVNRHLICAVQSTDLDIEQMPPVYVHLSKSLGEAIEKARSDDAS